MFTHHPSENCPFPSHSSVAIMVYLIFLIQSRLPKPIVILNSLAHNSLPYYIIPLAKISSAPQRGIQHTFCFLKSFPAHSSIFLSFLFLRCTRFFFISLASITRLSLIVPISFSWHIWESTHSYWVLISTSFRGSTPISRVKILKI